MLPRLRPPWRPEPPPGQSDGHARRLAGINLKTGVCIVIYIYILVYLLVYETDLRSNVQVLQVKQWTRLQESKYVSALPKHLAESDQAVFPVDAARPSQKYRSFSKTEVP